MYNHPQPSQQFYPSYNNNYYKPTYFHSTSLPLTPTSMSHIQQTNISQHYQYQYQ